MADPTVPPAVLAAGAGSAVAIKFLPGESWLERLTNGAAGFACAFFLAPAAAAHYHLTDDHLTSGLSFVVGLFGVAAVSAIMTGIKGFDIAGWVNRKMGGGK